MFRIVCLFLFILFILPSEVFAQVKLNEFVPDSSPEWIEFYNASSSADYIKNYYIDDDTDFESDSGSSSKKLLTSLNTVNPTFPFIDTSSFLNNSGDWVVIFDSAGILIDKYQFTSNPGKDISFGRYPDNSGEFSVLPYSTKADSNAHPATPTPEPAPVTTPTPVPLTPTPEPPKTPTPYPTKTPTPKPTPKPTTEISPDASLSATVLGEKAESTPSPKALKEDTPKEKLPVLAIGAILTGIIFIVISIYLGIKKKNENVDSSLV